MSALPEYPTERDRERFRDITKAMRFGLEYDRLGTDGQYKNIETETAFRAWWSAERERQLLQNLNQSQAMEIQRLINKIAQLERINAKVTGAGGFIACVRVERRVMPRL